MGVAAWMDRKFFASLLHTGWLQTNPLSFGEAEQAGAFVGREWGVSFHRQRASPGWEGVSYWRNKSISLFRSLLRKSQASLIPNDGA